MVHDFPARLLSKYLLLPVKILRSRGRPAAVGTAPPPPLDQMILGTQLQCSFPKYIPNDTNKPYYTK